MRDNPLVTVIVPSYNHSRFVAETLRSIFDQTYPNVELVVIDDGSKDNSAEIIRALQQEHPFTFVTQANAGLTATLNRAIGEYASGELVCIVASDDFWAPGKLEKQVKYLQDNPEYDMVFSNAYLVDNDSKVVGAFEEKRLKHDCSLEDLMLDRFGIPALTVMLKRKLYTEVGLYNKDLIIEDWDMWMRIANKHPIAYLPEKLAYYRVHDGNISLKFEWMMQNRMAILETWKNIRPELYEQAVKYWNNFAFIQLSKIDKAAAGRYLHIYPDSFLKRKFIKAYFRYLFASPKSA